ncbi:hypothetical protein D3C85_1073520 [compost metagenome]
MRDRIGRTCSRSAAAPPAMMASVPLAALATAPDTGASIRVMPASCSNGARRSVSAGLDEPMSISVAPRASSAARPGPSSPPSITALVMALLGSIVMITVQSARSASVSAGCSVTPQAGCVFRRSSRRGSRSWAWILIPCAPARFSSIGRPIIPRPTNPSFNIMQFLYRNDRINVRRRLRMLPMRREFLLC